MKDNKLKNSENALWILLSLFSALVTILVWVDDKRPDYYNFLYLLPLSYSIINFLSRGLYREIFDVSNNLAKLIIHLLFFIRQSLAIFFLWNGNYVATLSKMTVDNVNRAIVLVIFETICVYTFLCNCQKIKLANVKKLRFVFKFQYKNTIKTVGVLLSACTIFCIVAYYSSSLVQNSYSALWDSSLVGTDNYYLTRLTVQAGSRDRIIYTLFTMIFDFIRILVPCWFLFMLRRYIGQRFICIIIGFVICVLQLSMISNETVYVLLTVLLTGLFIMKIYPKYKRYMLASLVLFGGGVVIFLFVWIAFAVSVSSSGSEVISDMFQIYFPGISNVACGFNVVDSQKWTTLFFDIYEAIPFHNSVFGLHGDRLSTIYNSSNNVKYTITPSIYQEYHYLGIIAPLATCFIVKIALDSQKKLRESKDMFSFLAYSLLMVYSAMTPICYYPTMLLSRFLNTILPMIILAKFAGKKYRFIDITKLEEKY